MKRTTLLSAVTPLAVAVAAVLAVGDLTPPPGAVAETGKRLAELEPRIAVNPTNTPGDATCRYRITQPGSYYLTANQTGQSGANLIEVTSSGVSLDLNGFTLQGVAGSGFGIYVTANCEGVELRNGTVRGFGSTGITFDLTGTRSALLENIRAIGNSGGGMRVPDNSLARSCIASQNTGSGIQIGSNSSVFESFATANTTYGFFGAAGLNLVGCTASSNTLAGYSLSGNCVLRNCIAFSNGDGIASGPDSRVENCVVYRNTLDGIRVNGSSEIVGCSAYENTGDGIQTAGRCTLLENDCDANGYLAGDGAGIHCTGVDNRIEGNKCGGNDRGIDVDSSGSFLTRNICTGNTTNWDIAAGNVGLIVNATISAAVVGNSGGTAPGSTDPNANFTY